MPRGAAFRLAAYSDFTMMALRNESRHESEVWHDPREAGMLTWWRSPSFAPRVYARSRTLVAPSTPSWISLGQRREDARHPVHLCIQCTRPANHFPKRESPHQLTPQGHHRPMLIVG